jgi:protease-4
VTNPGTITGSIGVIMEFANLSHLYDWAKIQRYVIKSGPFKDIGSEARAMTPAERQVIQDMIDNVYGQFRKAVALGRKMKLEDVTKLADGRIYSGEQAVKNGLADSIGGLHEAVELAAKLSGVKGKPEMFFPPPKRGKFFDMFMGHEEDDEAYGRVVKKALGLELVGQPLFLMPGVR